MSDLLAPSTRIALAAYLHDLGKLAERACLDIPPERLDVLVDAYCPSHEEAGRKWHSHKHAAYTAHAFEVLESSLAALSEKELFPFSGSSTGDNDDSLLNAAARHHKPETFLQWVIATADRVASGFDRESFKKYNRSEDKTDTGCNHYQARQISLLEGLRLNDREAVSIHDLQYRQPLLPLSPESLFPKKTTETESKHNEPAQKEYQALWGDFLLALKMIPVSHGHNMSLWLDHFDSLWRIYTHAVPSGTALGVMPDVSLYDHSRTTSALASALWRYHYESGSDLQQTVVEMESAQDWGVKKFLLIQGDFFGIQNFIFAGDGDASNKSAARLLRGRSLYVSLLAETAALKVLDSLQLPSTSLLQSAAGKFLIVAPNTPATTMALESVQTEISNWFLQHTYAQAGLGLAWIDASCKDFVASEKGFGQLMKSLFSNQEQAKYQSFGLLTENAPPPVFDGYLEQVGRAKALCQYTGWGPGSIEGDDGLRLSPLAADQIHIGRLVAGKRERLAITRQPLSGGSNSLRLPLFGYYLHFTDHEEASGRFGNEARSGNLLRLLDFSLADKESPTAWNGYARRNINGYVPTFSQEDADADWRYHGIRAQDDEQRKAGNLKPFGHIACEDRRLQRFDENEKSVGIEALGILKGDIDNLGAVFQKGLADPTFARMAGLSRQVDSFFSCYLPWLCRERYPNTYTVFAGGDDFFLIGPWHSLIQLAGELHQQFQRYVAYNPVLHFSAGIALAKPGLPLPQLARMADDALEAAKQHPGKNAVHLLGATMHWDKLQLLSQACNNLHELADAMKLSTGFVYGLLGLADLAVDINNPEHALWRSRLNYRAWRHLQRRDLALRDAERRQYHTELMRVLGVEGIEMHGSHYRVAITTHLYLNRD